MLNNCPTIPEYKILSCTPALIFDFELDFEMEYSVHFTNNVGQLFQFIKYPLPTGEIIFNDFEFINDLYSPFIVEIFEEKGCEPITLSHCETDANQFLLTIVPVFGQTGDSITIPCCNA